MSSHLSALWSQPMPVTVNTQAAALRSGPGLNIEQFGKKITNMFKFGELKRWSHP